jgi:hypothetical protein
MGERRDAYKLLVKKREGKRPLGNLDIDERPILKWIFKKSDGRMDGIDLAQDRERWWAL